MSILIKGINNLSGSSKGFPPGDVSNVVITNGYKTVKLRWSDPNNTVNNGTTLSTWSSTIIVRKEGSAPTSIKDGTVVLTNTTKNKYSSTPYTDSNVVVGKTYYYRFYTLSTDKVYNDSTSMIKSIKALAADSILKNNTWDQINAASESGMASSLWKVGDEIDITLSGTYNETVTLQIWDFNHFDKSDGSGKAGICFGMKNLMEDDQIMNNSGSNTGGWNESDMRNTVMVNILNSMPSNLRNAIKEVNTYANAGNNSAASSVGKLCKDKVFLPGHTELFGTEDNNRQSITESNQKKFPIFTDNNSRMKKPRVFEDRYVYRWWTRSPAEDRDTYFCSVEDEGRFYIWNAYKTLGVCFCFNV